MSERQFTVEEVSKHNKEGDLVSATLRLNIQCLYMALVPLQR